MKILIFLILLFPIFCFGQKQGNIWYFGNNAGLDFNSGSPVVLNDGQTQFVGCPSCHSEGTSVIADSTGNLLFYCNGRTIWNKNHQVMMDGDSLLSNNSSTQSSLILPLPGNSRYFYVFTVDDFYFNNLQYGFRYSIVDMCLDLGLGGVIKTEKNILLLDNVCEKLTAVRHSNGIDYWVIVHKFQSNAFYCYHLSSTGIIDTVVSNIGSIHTSSPGTGGSQGQLKASPNGQKLALVNGNANPAIAEYFDFDKNTGVVSNMVSIQTNPVWTYFGVSFSPDNSKLYIASTLNGNGVYQFDLTAGGGNPANVVASKKLIAGTYNYLGLQLATDGKIYVARSPFGFNPYIGVINNPNNVGLACNYVDSAVYLNGNSASYGFPNFVDSYDYSNSIHNCETTGIENQEKEFCVEVFPNPFSNELTFTAENNEQLVVSIFDIFGQKILQETFTNKITINTDNFSNGIYIYVLNSDRKIITRGKVIKK